ncbi:hypothetical protein EON65_00270 [archaeon]|nr:MAG: hypothetical protein EON65_00270 [archaeon]
MQKIEEIDKPNECKVEDVLDFTASEREIETPAEDISTLEVKTKETTLIHVSFIGQPSGCDEWVDIASHRLAKWNTVSMGRKGDMKVRDEIYMLSAIYKDEEEPPGGKYAKNYANAFASKLYVVVVNHFAEHGGFTLLLQILKRLVQQKPADYLLKALPLTNIVGHVHRVVAKPQLVGLINETIRLINELLAAMGPVEIRQTPIEAIEVSLSHIESFSYDTHGKKPSVAEFIDSLRLRIGTTYLMSQFLNRRLGGLKLLVDLLKRAENAALYPSGLSIKPGNVAGQDVPSVYVVPVNYSFTTKRICEELSKIDVLDTLYNDSNIHESIVTRSAAILKAYAEEGLLKDQDIQRLVQSSLTRDSPVKKVLEEAAGYFSISSMKVFLLTVHKQEGSALNEGLISILASIGSSSRRKLMSSQSFSAENKDCENETRTGFLEIHSLVADILWGAAGETSSASNDIKLMCMNKLENLIDLGVGMNAALEDNYFPWAMQWYRVQDLIRKAIHSLVSHSSVIPGVKILQAFLYSWPIKKPSVVGDQGMSVPFQPMRFGAADFIISKYDAYAVATDCIVRLREQAQSITGLVLSYKMDYSHQLELLLDFVYNLFRSSEKTLLPVQELFRLWDLMVTNAMNVDEFDLVVALFGKIATRIGDNLNVQLNRSEEKLQSSRAQLTEIYTQLICDKAGTGFFKSPYFSLRTLTRTVEKWFRWINSELGLLVESKDLSKILSIKVDLSALQGIDIFLNIVLSCDDDEVASCCVNFIISLIQTGKSYALTYRETLLSQCLQHLTELNGHVSLQRILLLLNGLIEESFASSKKKMYAHSITTTNRKITFKVSCTSKNFAGAGGELVMKHNNTVEELMKCISSMMQAPIEGIKVFKMGKEIMPADFRKPLGVLCTVGDRETLVVVERPLHTRIGQQESVDEEQEARNVAISLVCSEENTKTLFDLLKKASSSEVHSIWNTISQLPTFYYVLERWLRLSENTISDISFPLIRQNVSRLGELVYSLQVVEMLLEGTVSVEAVLAQYDKTVNAGECATNNDWINQFLSKGGFVFLCDSYKWITSILLTFQQDLTFPGVSSDLCVLGLFILNKLIRGLLAVHCKNSPKFAALASSLPIEIDRLLKRTQAGSSDPVVIDLTDLSENKEQALSSTSKTDDSECINDNLQRRNFTFSYSDWDGLYWHMLLSSLLVERAFLEKMKRPDGDNGSHASFSATATHMNQTEDSLKNILYVYTCIAVLSPSVLNSRCLQYESGVVVSYESVLGAGLSLGEEEKADSVVKLLKTWFVDSFVMFLRCIEAYYKEFCGTQALDDLAGVKSHIVGWLLSERPSIAVGQIGNSCGKASLFALTTKLLEDGSNSIVSSDRRREICKSIVQEVQSVVQACKANFMRLTIANLEGNMRILASLAKTDDKYVLSYFDKNIVEFFLQDVLGVVEVSKCTQPCIIESSDIRYVMLKYNAYFYY